MKPVRLQHSHDVEGDDLYSVSYETETPEQDLWFLPGPNEDEVSPFQQLDRRLLIDPADWQTAEAALAPQLARAAAELAMLDQKCRDLGQGAIERLALIEVEAMLWAQGSRVRREHIAAYLSGAGGQNLSNSDLGRVGWAYRRMLNPPSPLPELRSFLGLHEVGASTLPETLSPRPKGAEFDNAAGLFADGLGAIGACHPLTQAGFGLALWRLTGLSAPDDLVEPATAASRIAAQEGKILGFAPLAPGRRAWQLGSSAGCLGDWFSAIRSGAQTAMLELNRIDVWASNARAATAHKKGKTLGKLISALAARPIMTTETAAVVTGVSRDSAERGLAQLHAMGLVQEITGTKRFRLWSAGV